MTRIDFAAINRMALARLLMLLGRWLPDGNREGREYVARNPTRTDRWSGSFKVVSTRLLSDLDRFRGDHVMAQGPYGRSPTARWP